MASRLTKLAKELRNDPTIAEDRLWNRLRSRQVAGTKFRRQQPIDRHIVDFVSFEKRIIIELDGGQHAKSTQKDKQRDQFFEDQGYKVLRFWSNDIFENLEGVLEIIRQGCLKYREHPPPTPPIKGGEHEALDGTYPSRRYPVKPPTKGGQR